jgi:hypothetical protein
MATWKKIVVSGSQAHLAAVSASNLTENNLLIAGPSGAIRDSGLTLSANNLNLGAVSVSASIFTGSFKGDGSQLTGVVATNAFNLTQSTGIAPFTYNGGAAATVAVSGAAQLTNNAVTKWNSTDGKFVNSSLSDNGTAVTGTSSIQLSGASSSLTGSFTGSFIGDGSQLTGLVTTLGVSGSTGTGTVDLKTQNLSIVGTANEIETSVSGQTVTVGLPDNVTVTQNLTVGGNLVVQGTTTSLNTQDLFIEDKFIVLASGSVDNTDAGIMVDRGSYSLGNIAYGFDATLSRWGYQNGLTDTTNAITFSTLTAGVANNAFATYAFTEATHGATKPTSGEFLQLGAMYVATNEDIWIYS